MKRAAAALPGIALAAGLAVLPGAQARELWSRGEARVEWSGTLRELAVGTRGTDRDDFAAAAAAAPATCSQAAGFPDCPAFGTLGEASVWTSLTRLRNRLDLRATPHWSAVAVYDHELLAGTLDTFEADLGEALATPGWLDADGTLARGRHARWRHVLYRGFVSFESEPVEVVAGRQRIPWGVGRLWNPIDRFNAIRPLALEGDQSPGVDALLARWVLGGFSFVEAVFAPEGDVEDSDAAVRLHGVARDVDVSLMAGVFDAAPTLGLDLAGNLGGAAGRLEVVYARPRRNVRPVGAVRSHELADFWQLVASVDHVFDAGEGVYVLAEYLYNGNALGFGAGGAGGLLPLFEATPTCPPIPGVAPPCVRPGSADRFGGSRVITRSRHLTGLQLGYDLTPEIRGELVALQDWDGRSASFFPSLRYSPVDWLEVSLAGQLFAGRRRSEFGDAEPLAFLLLDAFF